MRLIITRHGETDENKEKNLQGHLPGKLTKLGIEQAKKLAKRLQKEKIDVIFTSDLARALDTAKEIHKYHKETPLNIIKELRERDIGKYAGEKVKDRNGFFQKINKNPNFYNVETRQDVEKRVKKVLYEIVEKYKNSNVLLVAHNGVNKNLIRIILKESNLPHEDLENQPNTAINIFEINEDKNHKIHIFNCVKHLEQ